MKRKNLPEDVNQQIADVIENIIDTPGEWLELRSSLIYLYHKDDEDLVETLFMEIKSGGYLLTDEQLGSPMIKIDRDRAHEIKKFNSVLEWKTDKDKREKEAKKVIEKKRRVEELTDKRESWRKRNWVWVEIGKVIITTILSTLLVLLINKLLHIN